MKRLIKWLKVFGVFLATLALYVLSVGPAYWLSVRGILPDEAFEVVYAPLEYIPGTGTNSPLMWYFRLWE